eukprot:gnl/TRDRNA2_/TRDRNA2_101004_c0_seq1.p1 gnl/TRDRNA2_/TRDRNA2_101004_c0~~gnl/TRDRNA2_/TRDRNA2_101004_c0_seq1.p1  ORF type:complete len:551 (-),score=86.20 gnl/TRDRNA2_/TRDRNA2_101004_c0_seq1:56-1708(-)
MVHVAHLAAEPSAHDLVPSTHHFLAQTTQAYSDETAFISSAALRCITALTIFYFAVYLVMILVRLCRIFVNRQQPHLTSWEAVLAHATEGLALVPMLCILMIVARLRAMQLGRPQGDPPVWAQGCMYFCSAFFILHFGLHISKQHAEIGDRVWQIVHLIARSLVSFALYGGCIAIVVSVLIMQSPNRQTLPQMPMMSCVIILTFLYFGLYQALDVAGSVRAQSGPSTTGATAVAAAAASKQLERMALTLQFTPMYCILLVGITMRAVQLKLKPEPWAQIAMFVTTGAIAAQAALALYKPHLVDNDDEIPEPPHKDGDEAAGPRIQEDPEVPLEDRLSSIGWWLTMGCLYVGITATLVSVFTMEANPVGVLWPEDNGQAGGSAPISTAMRCVMLVTVLYFSVFLCLMVHRVATQATRRSAVDLNEDRKRMQVVNRVISSLAFVPMLCVMMIAVRLRAMQLHIRDPQLWAQVAMYIATVSVTIMVLASAGIMAVSPGVDLEECKEEVGEVTSVAGKVCAIILLTLRYAAAACMYGAMAALITALFVMKPADA